MSLDMLYAVTVGGFAVAFLATLRARLAAPVAFAIAGGLIYLEAFHVWSFVVDDAYISFRYSYNLAHGHGAVFNNGEHVEGYTNFLWVLILALTDRVGLGIVQPSRWLGFASDIAILGVLWLFARRLAPESPRRSGVVFAGAALAFAALPATGYWAAAGLEEPLFTLLVLGALYRHTVEADSERGAPLSAVVALSAALTRPEGVLIAGVIFAFKVGDAIRSRDERQARSLALWCAIIGLPWLTYVGWRFGYYGYPLPNTYYQKVSGTPFPDWERYRDGIGYVRAFWAQTGAVVLFPLTLLPLVRREQRRVVMPLVAFSFTWTAYVIYVGGDFMSFHRFMTPVVPIGVLLASDGIVDIAARFDLSGVRWRSGVVSAIGTLALAAWLIVVPQREIDLDNFRTSARSDAVEITTWLNTQDRATYLAVGSAGYIPYETRLRTLDTLGLTDEHIAHGRRLNDSFEVQGHRKGDGAYVIAQQPDLIIVFSRLDLLPQSGIGWAHMRDAGQLLAADRDLLSQPDFWQTYDAVWVKLPSGKYFNFFRLTGSTKVEGTLAAFQ